MKTDKKIEEILKEFGDKFVTPAHNAAAIAEQTGNENKIASCEADLSQRIWAYNFLAQSLGEINTEVQKDQVQAECEKYLDEFFELLVDKGYIEKGEVYIHAKSWVKKFKKEQREHENNT